VPKVNEFLSLASTHSRGEGGREKTMRKAEGREEPITKRIRTRSVTPLKAVRGKCIDCRGFELGQVRECDFSDCPLHGLRMGRGSRAVLKPIRSFCLWCFNSQRAEVRACPSKTCPLWQYRLGRRPQTGRVMPEIASTEGGSDTSRTSSIQTTDRGNVRC